MAAGTRLEYEKRVNRAIDHVRAHLGEPLTLAGLARVAAFSPFHFHRIFRALTGETLSAYVQRQRVERAAGLLAASPRTSILDVALDHGFASAATFARAFRARFGMSATQWRRGGADRWRAQNRKLGKASRSRRRHTPVMAPELRTLPDQRVAYMRHVGPYGTGGIPALWSRLRDWMAARDLSLAATVRLGVSYDDAGITAPARCAYDACVVVPADFAADARVTLGKIAGGRYALAPFRGTALEIEDAWQRVFADWLPASGFQPDDRPSIEIYRGGPRSGGAPGSFQCELALPLRPL